MSGDVSVDTTKDRNGAKGLEAAGTPAGRRKGGSLRLGPGGKAVWPLRDKDGAGTVRMWVYEDAAKPAKPQGYGAGAMWGLMQADGHMVAVGAMNGTSLSFGRSVWPLAAHEAVTAVWLHRMAVLDMPHAGTCV